MPGTSSETSGWFSALAMRVTLFTASSRLCSAVLDEGRKVDRVRDRLDNGNVTQLVSQSLLLQVGVLW